MADEIKFYGRKHQTMRMLNPFLLPNNFLLLLAEVWKTRELSFTSESRRLEIGDFIELCEVNAKWGQRKREFRTTSLGKCARLPEMNKQVATEMTLSEAKSKIYLPLPREKKSGSWKKTIIARSGNPFVPNYLSEPSPFFISGHTGRKSLAIHRFFVRKRNRK